VKEFQRLDSITPIQRARRSRLVARKEEIMHRNLSKFATVALAAAIGLGVPALAKSTHGGKAKHVASLSTRDSRTQRQRARNAGALNARALNAYGSVGRAPTFGAPNPNHPAFTGGGSTGYNANLYVY
jgi:hypothetical protein